MAKLNRVATLYAKAFFQVLEGSKDLDAVIEELRQFSGWLAESAELKRALVSPMLTKEQRGQLLKDLLVKAKANPSAARVITVLTEKRRLDSIDGVLQILEDMKFDKEGVTPIYVTSGLDLDAGSRKKLETKFETVLKKKVKANYAIEPSLIAGVQVTANGKTYEGSMAGWLSRLNEEFAGGIHS